MNWDYTKIDPENPATHPPIDVLVGVAHGEDIPSTEAPDVANTWRGSPFGWATRMDITHWCHLQSREARELASKVKDLMENGSYYREVNTSLDELFSAVCEFAKATGHNVE